MKKFFQAVIGALGTIVLAIGALGMSILGTEYRPGDVVQEEVICSDGAQALQVDEPFT